MAHGDTGALTRRGGAPPDSGVEVRSGARESGSAAEAGGGAERRVGPALLPTLGPLHWSSRAGSRRPLCLSFPCAVLGWGVSVLGGHDTVKTRRSWTPDSAPGHPRRGSLESRLRRAAGWSGLGVSVPRRLSPLVPLFLVLFLKRPHPPAGAVAKSPWPCLQIQPQARHLVGALSMTPGPVSAASDWRSVPLPR